MRASLPVPVILVAFTAGVSTNAATAEDAATVAARLDALVEARWHDAGVEPAEPATDAEFLRRAYLDIAGRIPTADEARAFLTSEDPGKRESLVERILHGTDFAEHWARQLGIVLMGRGRLPRSVDRAGFEGWLRESLARNAPYDRLVRDIVTATGNPVDSPAVNYLLRFEQKPEDIAESVAASFLGVSIGCARCHDHPYEPWTQDDFYGMAASFGGLELERLTRQDRRTRREFRRKVEAMRQERERDGEMTPEERRRMREGLKGDADSLGRTIRLDDDPRKKLEAELDDSGRTRTFSARFLDGTTPQGEPRQSLAEWIGAPENPYFARATVNRVWDALFGRGLVDPVDTFGASNPPSHPEVLDLLARDFTENGFDLRRLFTILAQSETYQLSSRFAGQLPAPELFAAARPRRMSPAQLFESFVTLGGLDGRARFEERRELFFRQFVFLFDTDAVNDVEVAQGTVPQSLFLLNGRMTNQTLARSPFGRSVDELFLAVLSRLPTAEEQREVAAFLEAGGPRARDDVLWALVNSSEFLMVH